MGMAERCLTENRTAIWSPNAWRSGHLRRVTESTLGAEAQAATRGLKELLWSKALWAEMVAPLATDTEARVHQLQQIPSVLITDCKSLFDNLTNGGVHQGRTAVQVTIGRFVFVVMTAQQRNFRSGTFAD